MISMGTWLNVPGGTWSPDANVAAEAALKLRAYAEQQASAKGLTLQQWPSYTFQYQGRDVSGHHVLYINAFCGQPPAYVKTQLVQVLDGGTCYFSAYYDPVKKAVFWHSIQRCRVAASNQSSKRTASPPLNSSVRFDMRMRLLSRFAIGFFGALVVSAEAGAFQCTPIPAGVDHAVAQITGTPLPEHQTALYDLHPGGAREALVYLSGPEWCGSGGCTLLVFEQHGARWHPVSRITLARPPIRALPVASGGWAALFVQVSGGGIINGYTAELPFGANGYASNPTVPPARPIAGPPGGVTLIGAHGCSDRARVAPNNSSKPTRVPRAA